jgi:hypothetical protein
MNSFLESFSDGKKRIIVFCHDAIMATIIWPLALAIRFGELSFNFEPLSHSIIICFVAKILSFQIL